METTKDKCNRCGNCCIAAPCWFGEEDKFGICENLVFERNNKTSCGLVVKGELKPKDIESGRGCQWAGIQPETEKRLLKIVKKRRKLIKTGG